MRKVFLSVTAHPRDTMWINLKNIKLSHKGAIVHDSIHMQHAQQTDLYRQKVG